MIYKPCKTNFAECKKEVCAVTTEILLQAQKSKMVITTAPVMVEKPRPDENEFTKVSTCS